MTTETNVVETPVVPLAAKNKAAKKATKKVLKKVTKKIPKKEPVERTPRDPNKLGKPMVRILKLLSKGKALTRAQISEKAPVDNAFCTTYLGSVDEEKRLANEEKRGTKSLLTRKYVRAEQHEGEAVTYSITATGKAALAKQDE